jgi:hypothetical protein
MRARSSPLPVQRLPRGETVVLYYTKGISRYRWLPLLVASLAWLVWLALLRRRLTRPAPPTPRGGEPNDADSGAPIGARDPYVPLILL